MGIGCLCVMEKRYTEHNLPKLLEKGQFENQKNKNDSVVLKIEKKKLLLCD